MRGRTAARDAANAGAGCVLVLRRPESFFAEELFEDEFDDRRCCWLRLHGLAVALEGFAKADRQPGINDVGWLPLTNRVLPWATWAAFGFAHGLDCSRGA